MLMSSTGEEQSIRENSLLNNSSTNSNFGDNFERSSQLLTAENARLIRELEDQKEETRKMRMERDEFKSQLFGLQERYVQSNERLYKEIRTPKCSDGKQTEELASQLNGANEKIRSQDSQKEELSSKNALAEEQVLKNALAIVGRLKEANENIKRLELEKKDIEKQLEMKSEQVKTLDRDLCEAKKLGLEKEKLQLEGQSKLQNDLQNVRNEDKKVKDQCERTIKKLRADLLKAETIVKNLRTTIAEMKKNNVELTEKCETMKREQDELAKKAKEEHAKKIKHLRAELEKAEGENCDKPIEKEMAKIDENEKNCSEPEKSQLDSNAKLVSRTLTGGSGLKPIVRPSLTRKRTLPADRITFDDALSLHKRNKLGISAETSQIAETAKIMSKIYAFSLTNSQQWAKFDCVTNNWIGLPFGGFDVGERAYFDVATLGRKIFIIGGKINGKSSTNCYANEPESISILRNAPIISELETPRQKHSSVTIEDTIYVFGGKYTATKLTPVECYSSEASAWAQKGENKPRNLTASAVFDRVAYVFGGYDGHARLNIIERYDPREAKVERVANMKERRVRASAVTHNGRIYVAGGYNGKHLDTVEIFDPRTNACINGPAMNTPRAWHCLFSDGTRLLAIGGNNANLSLNSMEVLVPSGTENNDKWINLPATMPFSGGIRIAAI